MDVVAGLWDTWEDDAILHDRAAGTTPTRPRCTSWTTSASYFSARGPLTVPRTPQGRPVIIQAGSSGRGREFASRWAELIFTGDPGIEVARSHYADQKERIADAGRDPAAVRICPMAYAVVGESEAHAKEREAVFLNDLVAPHGVADTVVGVDELRLRPTRSRRPGDRRAHRVGVGHPRAGAEPAHPYRWRHRHRARPGRPPRHPAAGAALRRHRRAGRRPDGGWFESGACDGFVLAATHLPGAFEDVVRMVVPELQRRGLFRTAYESSTLRGHLGLQRPSNSRVPAGAGV